MTMITIRKELHRDVDAREALLDQAFGDTRYRKSSERLREDRLPAEGLAFTAAQAKRVVGTARLWNVDCGNGTRALLLGPVAVSEDCRGRGIGADLVRRSLREARRLGHGAVILVGDAAYYSRFGFSAEKTGTLVDAGPVRAPPAAGGRTHPRRARRRARADQRHRPAGAETRSRRPGGAGPSQLAGAPPAPTRGLTVTMK